MTTVKKPAKIPVSNANHPEMVKNLDAAKYDAVKVALLKVLPKKTPGRDRLSLARASFSKWREVGLVD
jgi:hypothetical protein